MANTEYVRIGSGLRGRQSQTCVRFPEGWRIVAAHVNLLRPRRKAGATLPGRLVPPAGRVR